MRRKKKVTGGEIVTRQETLPADFNMADLAGLGSEDITVEDLPRPALKLLQALSPECSIGHEKFVENAVAGLFYNASTRMLFTGNREPAAGDFPQLVFVPVKYTRRELEFGRNRGGFVAEHLPGASITETVKIVIDEKGKQHRITESNTELVDTSIFYGLIIDPETKEPTQAIVSLSSTGKRFAKDFNGYMTALRDKHPETGKAYQPALCSRAYTLYATHVNDTKGSYYTWGFVLNTVLDPKSHGSIIFAARDYLDLIADDAVKIDHGDTAV